MNSIHPSLFDHDDAPPTPADRALVIRPTAARPLSKAERAFNRAVTRIQTLRAGLEEEKRRLDQALVFHAAEVRPRVDRAVALRGQMVRAIAPFLDDRRLKPADRKVLQAILIDQLGDILANVETLDTDLQPLFERLHGIGYTAAIEEDMAQMRSEMSAAFAEMGVDLDVPDLRPGMSDEDMAAAAAQFADDLSRMEEVWNDAADAHQPTRRKTKRQLREEEQIRRYEQTRKDSIGAVYRRLVKALHPDLERDDAERLTKSARLQEVTAAYARNDLHALLRFELQWIDGAQAEAARLGDEKLRAYTEVLKEQAAQLEAELDALRFHPRYAALIVEGPLGMIRTIDGPVEAARLDYVIETVGAGLALMTSGRALQEVRRAIQEYRRVHKARQKHARMY